MGGTGWPLLLIWAQVSATTRGASPSPSTTSNLPMLALRRWFASQTLSSPEAIPTFHGLILWLGALGVLLLIAMIFQGPGRAIRQALDIPGHFRLGGAAVNRIRRSARMIAVVVGTTVLSWTGSQTFVFNNAQGREDVVLLTRSRGLGELAAEQGVLAALTPLRDVASLGSNLPLLIVAVLILFRVTADQWSVPTSPGKPAWQFPIRWATMGWSCGALLILYRLVALGTGQNDLPPGGCLMIEGAVIPVLMMVADGVLLAWVVAELRDAEFDQMDRDVLDPTEAVRLMPGSVVACLATLPSRYLATAVMLVAYYLPSSAGTGPVGIWMRWLLFNWGLADLQAAALVMAGLAGSLAWSRGSISGMLAGYSRILREHGGSLLAVFAIGGMAAGMAAAAAYLALLSLPSGTWILNAADSYAHYLTLPVGLMMLAALVELAEKSLPIATLVRVEPAYDVPGQTRPT